MYNNNQELDYLLTEEGMVKKLGSTYTYEYYLKDHLGNNRVLFQAGQATPGQVTEFYLFGMAFEKNNLGENKYLYNGKELQEGMDTNGDGIVDMPLDWYDYGARFYDPQIARFHTQDRFAEKYLEMTPYQYGANNPIYYIDVNGDSIVDHDNIVAQYTSYVNSRIGALQGMLNNENFDFAKYGTTREQVAALVGGLQGVIGEIGQMEASDQIYDVMWAGADQQGGIAYSDNGHVGILIGNQYDNAGLAGDFGQMVTLFGQTVPL